MRFMQRSDMALARKPYVVLDSEILSSSVWSEAAHVRLVWITLLILCDTEGYVGASIPGIATAAGVSLDQAQEAIARFQSPDPFSRTRTNDGRRLEVAERGFRVLNFMEHLDRLSSERVKARDRMKRHRERKRQGNAEQQEQRNGDVTVPTVSRDVGSREKGNRENGKETSSVALAPAAWNRDAAELWYQEYKGDAPGRFFAGLKPIVDKYTWERVRPALVTYLAETEAKFLNIPSAFGAAFGTWEARAKGAPSKGGQYQTGSEKTMAAAGRFLQRGEIVDSKDALPEGTRALGDGVPPNPIRR